MMIATGKSFRAERESEVIRWGKELSAVSCQLSDKDEEKSLEVRISPGEVMGRKMPIKRYLVNGVVRRMVDFVGNLRAVLFWPEHLELVTDSPSLRRSYLDSVLVQVDREYRRNLLSYERGLRQRNRLLDFINERKAHRHQLLFWDQLLIKTGGYLTEKRAEFIDFINRQAISDKNISDKQDENFSLAASRFLLTYDKSVISKARLEQYVEEEVAAKATLVGPHRDDFIVEKAISDKNISDKQEEKADNVSPVASRFSLTSYGSRGEQRLAVLWLKLAELAFIEEKTGERPILLLDDIFSELDLAHQKLVFGIVSVQQTVISSVDEDIVGLVKNKGGKSLEIIRLPMVE